MEFFDAHAHYNDEKFNEDKTELINDIYNFGITKLISAGYNIKSSKEAIELSKKHEFIYATCGISPNDIPEKIEQIQEQLSTIKQIAQHEKIVAIGEIGLDYYWNKENKDIQKEIFIKQIEIANELKLPIVIHTREAISNTLEILKKYKVNKKGIFHCCALNRELIKEALKLGFYISFAGPITFKNSKNAEEIIKLVPLEKILIETDSPYLSPEPNRGKRNDSRNIKYIAQKIAESKQIQLEEIAKITYENACKIYEIK